MIYFDYYFFKVTSKSTHKIKIIRKSNGRIFKCDNQKKVVFISLYFFLKINLFLISSDGKSINFEEFLDYYYDVNATLPTDKEEYFIDVNKIYF